jgi:hypothetical protein
MAGVRGSKANQFILTKVIAALFGAKSEFPSLRTVCATIAEKTGWESPQFDQSARWAFVVRYGREHLGIAPAKPARLAKTKKYAPSFSRKAFYESREWRELRYEVIKKFGGACQACGATAKSSGRPIHVDHIKPRSKFPELELVFENLQILCEDCNLGKSWKDATDWR